MNYSHTDRTVPSRLAGPVFFVLLFGACNVDTSPLHNRETKDTNKEDKRTEERLTSERKVVKKGGWLKIDISRSSIKQSREPVKGHRGVFFSTIVPQQEVVIELNCDGIDRENSYVDACDRYPFGSTYSVLEAMAYDVGHKVFCLNVVVRKISNGNKGGPLLISIFDEDGDGLFETLYTSASMSTFHVPEWLTGAS